MRKHVPRHDDSQSWKAYSAESRPARYFMRPARCLRTSAAASACSPYCRIRASAIFRRSCFLEMRSGGLCVALTPESVDDVFTPNVDGADLIEVRLDYLKDPQQANHVRWDRLPLPVIATCRGARFGGKFQGSLEEECTILETAARNGARYVDIDYRHARLFGAAEVIASYHNFE